MRIHTALTATEVLSALTEANTRAESITTDIAPNSERAEYRPHTVTPMVFERFDHHGSRTHARAFDVRLSGDATNWINSGRYGDTDDGARAASYDQWGLFLSEIYARDETARIPQIYYNAEHFHWATGERYQREIWTPADYHRRHKWQTAGTSAAGTYYVGECAADTCGAITRRVAWGHRWSEISETAAGAV